MKTSAPHPTHIVLLGGGYVSIWAYRSLVSRLRPELNRGTVRITVVCPHNSHFFHGWTAESLTGIIRNVNRLSPLTEIMPRATHLRGTAEHINAVSRKILVQLTDGSFQWIGYDHLLVGIGSFDSEAVTGIRQFGYQVKSPEGFDRTFRTFQRLIGQAARSDAETARQLLRVVVAGGGFAGVELATNLAEQLDLARRQHPSLRDIQPQIHLVHNGPQVLRDLQPTYGRLIQYAEKTLHQYGIRVLNDTRMKQVTKQGAHLSDGSFVEASMVISTIGQSRFRLSGTEAMPRDGLDRLLTNLYQQVAGEPRIWGGGDACHVAHAKTGKSCPANALWAIKHGEYAGRNIARAIRGQRLKPFSYPGLGQSASLGLGKGITELYGFQFTGPLAWVMRWFFFHYFMPSRRRMIGAVSDWFYLLLRRQRRGLQPAAKPASADKFAMASAT